MKEKWVLVLVGCGSLLGLHFLMKSIKEKKKSSSACSTPAEGKRTPDTPRKRVHFSPIEEFIDDPVGGFRY